MSLPANVQGGLRSWKILSTVLARHLLLRTVVLKMSPHAFFAFKQSQAATTQHTLVFRRLMHFHVVKSVLVTVNRATLIVGALELKLFHIATHVRVNSQSLKIMPTMRAVTPVGQPLFDACVAHDFAALVTLFRVDGDLLADRAEESVVDCLSASLWVDRKCEIGVVCKFTDF